MSRAGGGARPPWLRLGAFYACHFAALGVFVPYWPLYLTEQGLGPRALGLVMGGATLVKIVAPNLWGAVGDRHGHLHAVRAATAGAVIVFAGFLAAGSVAAIAVLMMLFGLFWNGSLPQFEAVTLRHLGRAAGRYARVRLWGSIGFIAAVAAGGALVARAGVGAVPVAVLVLLAGTTAAALAVPPAGPAEASEPCARLGDAVRRPAVLALLGAALLMQVSHGPFYVFFTVYLDDLGHGAGWIGALWSLGVAAEVVAFAFMPWLLARRSPRTLLLACFAAGAARWLVVAGLAGSVAWLALAQVLHAATFGVHHAVSIHLLHRLFPARLAGRAQGLYASVGFGVGGALGGAGAGEIWSRFGPGAAWTAAAAASVLAGAVVWRWLVEPDRLSRPTSRRP